MARMQIIHGDCVETMARLANSGVQVDTIATDPPYHLQSIVKRFGAASSTPAQHGTDGAFARASRGFQGQTWDGGDVAFRPETWAAAFSVIKPGGHLFAFSHSRTYHRMACAIEDAGFEIRDMNAWLYGSGMPKSHSLAMQFERTLCDRVEVESGAREWRYKSDGEPMALVPDFRHPQANLWWGWGTAQKPALEPICVARKPLIGTVMANAVAHGVGALNIRKSMIAADGEPRWPANVIHDGSDEVMRAFPDSSGQRASVGPQNGAKKSVHTYGDYGPRRDFLPRLDDGSAARFFYSAKASAADRMGSDHPTVKPVDLMAWLIGLATPPGGTVLDPFAGSGSTGAACMREGFGCILIEQSAEYVADIRRRLDHIGGRDSPLFAALSDVKISTDDTPPFCEQWRNNA